MKKLNVISLFLYGCLFWFCPVKAQELDGDTTGLYKMSYDKADSLLISSLKENEEGKKKKATVKRSERLAVQTTRFDPLNEEDGAVDYRDLLSVNEGTLVGVGGYRM